MDHELHLGALLDKLESREPGTLAHSKANRAVNQYFGVALLCSDMSIPSSLILRTYKISIRQLGYRATIKGVIMGIRIALFN